MKKLFLTLLLLWCGTAYASWFSDMFSQPQQFSGTVCLPQSGCTGKGSATAGDIGKYLKVSNNSPFTYSFDTPTATVPDPLTLTKLNTTFASTTQLTVSDKSWFGGDMSLGTILNVNHVLTVSKNNGGTGYTGGDILTLTAGDGNTLVEVDSVTAGVIDSVTLLSGGTNYVVGTSGVTGGTGNNDAVINILTVGAISQGQFNVNQPSVPTINPLQVLGSDGYLRFAIDPDGRFVVAGPTSEFTIFDRGVNVAGVADSLNHYTQYVDGNVFRIHHIDTGAGDDTELLTLDNTGRLGVGNLTLATSTSGCASFSPLGELYSTGSACGSGSGNWFTPQSYGNSTSTLINFLAGASTTQLTTTGSTYLATTGGNVGIGTTTPWGKLAVNGNFGETNQILFNVASSTVSATTSLFVIMNNGNVGIGTTSPTALLDISSPTNDTRFSLHNSVTGYTSGDGILWEVDSNKDMYLWNYESSNVNIGTSNLNRLAISSGGNVGLGGSIVGASTMSGATMVALATGKVGIGTTSPWGKLSVHTQYGTNNSSAPLFVVASSTNSATTTEFEIDQYGHALYGGDTPTLTSCGGAAPAAAIPAWTGEKANDNNGSGKAGSGSLLSCTLTFAHPWPYPPHCDFTWASTTGLTYFASSTATAVTVTTSASFGGRVFTYICNGNM